MSAQIIPLFDSQPSDPNRWRIFNAKGELIGTVKQTWRDCGDVVFEPTYVDLVIDIRVSLGLYPSLDAAVSALNAVEPA